VKKVEALIHPSVLEAVQSALEDLDVGGMTISEVTETGGGPMVRASYRGRSFALGAMPRLRIEIVADDAYGGPIAWTIAKAARNGRGGEAAVSIHDVEEALRIRTGERGVAAVTPRRDDTEAAIETVRAPREAGAARARVPMSDRTKVLLANVILATAVVVLFFHAPVTYAGGGAAVAGVLLWGRERLAQARRTR